MIFIFKRLIPSSAKTIRRLTADERGVSAVVTGIALTVVLGFGGLAVDTGYWLMNQRNMQGAADQAAFAAATQTGKGTAASAARTTAQGVAANMGFTGSSTDCSANSTTNVTICANNPPSSGSYSSNAHAWEVTISQPQPMWLSNLIPGLTAPTAAVRAVAAPSTTSGACVIALDTGNDNGAFTVSGSATGNFSNCDVYVNSSNATGLDVSGSGKLTATNLYVNGSANDTPTCSSSAAIDVCGIARTNTGMTVQDPYHETASLTCASPSSTCRQFPPLSGTGWSVSASSCTVSTSVLTAAQQDPTNANFIATASDLPSTATSIYPGVYCGKLLTTNHVTMNKCSASNSACNNVYIVYKDFGTSGGSSASIDTTTGLCNSSSGNPYLNGSGITVFLYGSLADGHLSVSAGGCVSLTAPTTDTYTVSGCSGSTCGDAGLALWQPQYASGTCAGHNEGWSGSAIAAITGAVDTPCNNLAFTGSSGSSSYTTACTQLVAFQLTESGSATMNHNCSGTGISDLYTYSNVKVVQ